MRHKITCSDKPDDIYIENVSEHLHYFSVVLLICMTINYEEINKKSCTAGSYKPRPKNNKFISYCPCHLQTLWLFMAFKWTYKKFK